MKIEACFFLNMCAYQINSGQLITLWCVICLWSFLLLLFVFVAESRFIVCSVIVFVLTVISIQESIQKSGLLVVLYLKMSYN